MSISRDLILESAAQVFCQKGYNGASMADIADAVGLQKATLYHHFGSKQEILAELLDRAMATSDVQQKMDLYQLLAEDYPDDELADDALFLAANEALDTWGDRAQASGLLRVLLQKFPDSEYAVDAQYIIDNMARPGFTKPQSIEDLRTKP